MKLIYIDACMRPGSRTKRIAERLIQELSKKYDVETISLFHPDYPIVESSILKDRENGIVPEKYVEQARQIAEADRIVIAAPFWDMSFPSALKVFFENMSLFGVTFGDNGKECIGLCKQAKVLYITTRGMNIKTGDPLEQATPYIKALSHLWGLGELYVVSAENLDYSTPEELENRVQIAISEGLRICKDF